MAATIQSVAANVIEKITDDLILALNAMPDEKARWRPAENARTALEQISECCCANVMWTSILRTHVHASLPEGAATQIYEQIDDGGTVEATARLRDSSACLADTIRGMPDSDLDAPVQFPWHPEAAIPLAECFYHPYWNMCYHHGQISFIQTLYGDSDEHGDVGPFGEMGAATVS